MWRSQDFRSGGGEKKKGNNNNDFTFLAHLGFWSWLRSRVWMEVPLMSASLVLAGRRVGVVGGGGEGRSFVL